MTEKEFNIIQPIFGDFENIMDSLTNVKIQINAIQQQIKVVEKNVKKHLNLNHCIQLI